MLGPYLSSFLLCVTSIDRYRAICKPFKPKHTNVRSNEMAINHHSFFHNKTLFKTLVGAAWMTALICCTPQVLIFQTTNPMPTCYKGKQQLQCS